MARTCPATGDDQRESILARAAELFAISLDHRWATMDRHLVARIADARRSPTAGAWHRSLSNARRAATAGVWHLLESRQAVAMGRNLARDSRQCLTPYRAEAVERGAASNPVSGIAFTRDLQRSAGRQLGADEGDARALWQPTRAAAREAQD